MQIEIIAMPAGTVTWTGPAEEFFASNQFEPYQAEHRAITAAIMRLGCRA